MAYAFFRKRYPGSRIQTIIFHFSIVIAVFHMLEVTSYHIAKSALNLGNHAYFPCSGVNRILIELSQKLLSYPFEVAPKQALQIIVI